MNRKDGFFKLEAQYWLAALTTIILVILAATPGASIKNSAGSSAPIVKALSVSSAGLGAGTVSADAPNPLTNTALPGGSVNPPAANAPPRYSIQSAGSMKVVQTNAASTSSGGSAANSSSSPAQIVSPPIKICGNPGGANPDTGICQPECPLSGPMPIGCGGCQWRPGLMCPLP